MSENLNNNNNNKNYRGIQGVGENSFMHQCYYGSIAKIETGDILDFLRGFIKGLRGDVGIIFSRNAATKQLECRISIDYKANSISEKSMNTNGYIPVQGLNNRSGKVNDQILKSMERIKLAGEKHSVLGNVNVVIFNVDFAALIAEMLNPEKGYGVSIDEYKLHDDHNITVVASVFKSKSANTVNRLSKVLETQGFRRNNNNNNNQAQRYQNQNR